MKSLAELLQEHEDCDLEAKTAGGRDGRGEVPRSVWESYSAMANTRGGVILLGVKEDANGTLIPVGLQDIARVHKAFWDNINNREIVSANLLSEEDVVEMKIESVNILWINVPRATRTQRPVYTGTDPFTGTRRRNYEGDYKVDAETVHRMMAERVEAVRDERILPGYGLSDLNAESLAAYRNEMKSTTPNHPFLAYDEIEFLQKIGGWGINRQTGDTGLTLAGLLMFGNLNAILDAVPYYVVDYQERPYPASEQRWLDRVTTDGTWSGNLYDFFRRVFRKLTADLKVPFRLERNSKRIDEDHVHEALREALVNTLIHADFTDRIPILIVKRKDYFGFRNPGGLRLPIDVVLQGGHSDCRNRRLQKMFQFIGAGEQAGSGYPKILRAWSEQHWRYPLLDENFQPEQTVLRLPTTSLLPPETLEELDKRFGSKFRALNEIERLAVVTACIEKTVTNQRLRAMTVTHASDLTAVFKSLVANGFLVRDGVGWGTYYRLPGQSLGNQEFTQDPTESLFNSEEMIGHGGQVSLQGESSSQHNGNPSQHKNELSQHNGDPSQHKDELSQHNGDPLVAAAHARQMRRISPERMEELILQLCLGIYRTGEELSELLGRKPATLQNHYLGRMVAGRQLEYRYPAKRNQPEQGYRTVEADKP